MQEEPPNQLPEQNAFMMPSLGPGRFAFASGRAALPTGSLSMVRIKEIFGDDFPTPCIPQAPEQILPGSDFQGASRVCRRLSVDEDSVDVLPDCSLDRDGRSLRKGDDQDCKAHSNGSHQFGTCIHPHGCGEGFASSAQLGAADQQQLFLENDQPVIAGPSHMRDPSGEQFLATVHSNLPTVGRGQLSSELPRMQASVSNRKGGSLHMPSDTFNFLASSCDGSSERQCPGGAQSCRFDAPFASLAVTNPQRIANSLAPGIPTRHGPLCSSLQFQGGHAASASTAFVLGNTVPGTLQTAVSPAVSEVPSDRLLMNCLVPSFSGLSFALDGAGHVLGAHALQPTATCQAAAVHPMLVPESVTPVMMPIPLETPDARYAHPASTHVGHAPETKLAALGPVVHHGVPGFPSYVPQESHGDLPAKKSQELHSDETGNPSRCVRGIGERPLIRPVSKSRLQGLMADIMADHEGMNDTIEQARENACSSTSDKPSGQAAGVCVPAVHEHADGVLTSLNRIGLHDSSGRAAPFHPIKRMKGDKEHLSGACFEKHDHVYLEEPCHAIDVWQQQPPAAADLPQCGANGSSLHVATSELPPGEVDMCAPARADCEPRPSGPNRELPQVVYDPSSLPSLAGRDYGFASRDTLQTVSPLGTDLATVRHPKEEHAMKKEVQPESSSAGGIPKCPAAVGRAPKDDAS